MRKIFPALALVFCSFLVLIFLASAKPRTGTQPQHNSSPREEIYNKQAVLEADVERTRQLNRSVVSRQLMQTLQRNQRADEQQIVPLLEQLHNEHPHMMQLSWIQPLHQLDEAIQVGEVPKPLQHVAAATLREALYFLQKQNRQSVYQSTPIHDGDKREEYYVLGAAISEHGPYLLGFMHQNLVDKVRVEQRKNLRIVPFPSDKRFGIQSIDAETERDVDVHHAEDNEGTSHYRVQQVVVKFRTEPTAEQLAQIMEQINATNVQKLAFTYVFESTSQSTEQLIDYFNSWDIEYVEPHFLYMTNDMTNVRGFSDGFSSQHFVPNDLLFDKFQWNLPMIKTIGGWDLSRGSQDVIVAVIDTGVDLDHADLADNLVEGINVIDEGKRPYDDVGHGTHVAGIIAAIVNNYEGVSGMSWFNKVMPIKALDHTGAGSTYSVAQGIIWAVDNGAQVINMSLGNYYASNFLHDAIKYAYDRDVILISATGNDDTDEPGYPAAYPEVLAVAATNAYEQRALFSNFGHYVDVTAPGENIASTYPGNEYAAMSGTSMASPHAAALAAMIRSANPLLSNEDVMDIMRQSALDLGQPGRDIYYGYGQIDVAAALEQATRGQRVLDTGEGGDGFFTSILRRIFNW